jgi:Tfp pilus assembly protein PilV
MKSKAKLTLISAVTSFDGQFEQLRQTLETCIESCKHLGLVQVPSIAAIHVNTEIPQPHLAVSQRGVGLIEAIIGLFILTIILLSGAQLFRVHVEHLALVERARRADEQAQIAMNALAASSSSFLPDGNPFQGKGNEDNFAEGEAIQLDRNLCLAQANCDRIVRVPHTSDTGADFLTIGLNQAPPTNASVVYYRAWRVTTLDPLKRLRRITLAILPVEPNQEVATPIEPLALRQTDVVQRQ